MQNKINVSISNIICVCVCVCVCKDTILIPEPKGLKDLGPKNPIQ